VRRCNASRQQASRTAMAAKSTPINQVLISAPEPDPRLKN
jgi:hypothetical protein